MKFLFSPYGLVLILLIVAIVFFPRRMPDRVKRTGRPMRAFPDEPESGEAATPPADSKQESAPPTNTSDSR